MTRYNVHFIAEGPRIGVVRKKIADALGEDATGLTVTKIERGPESRSTRLGQAETEVESAKGTVEELRDELQEWRDNIPENLQSGEKAEQLDEAISELESIIDSLDQVDFSTVEFPGMM